MSYATVNGIKIHYQELNTEGSSTIVMIHGLLMGSLAMWYFTSARKLAEKHHIFMYDLRGHGKTERAVSGYDLDTMTSDLEMLLSARNIQKVSLVGYSFGALISMKFALRYPESIDKLCLIEAPLPPSRISEIRNFMKQDLMDMKKALPERMQQYIGKRKRQALKLLSDLRFFARKSTLVEDLQKEPDLDDAALKNINVPTLIIYGKDSICINGCERLSTLWPHADVRMLDGGHDIPISRTDEMNELLYSFFLDQ